MNITEKTGQMCGLKMVSGDEDIMLINDAGIVIRMNVSEISVIGRSTQGVRLMRIGDDTKVVCMEIIIEENGSEDIGEEEAESVTEAGREI
jgi:DNA gyrase subunit A